MTDAPIPEPADPSAPLDPSAPDDPVGALDTAVEQLRHQGIQRVHVVAWRDLDDPDAGGSEVHADEFMRRWADRGLEVLHRTSAAVGLPARAVRHGYQVDRRGSRYSVFGRTAFDEVTGRLGRSDAFVEIWNGVPWFSPLWYRRPRITIVHHVHGPMWDQIFPRPLAGIGRFIETRLAPPFYVRGATVTPSEATREELLDIGFRPERVTAVANGTDPRFTPGPVKTSHPSLIAVGRLAPVKRFDRLIEAAAQARQTTPELTLTIVGDGPLRPELQRDVNRRGAQDWISLPGYVDDATLISLYQSAWLTVSASLAEGWGLSLTEGAASGTPAVATDISGHRSSVVDGESGLLVPLDRLGATIASTLADRALLDRLTAGAARWGSERTWDHTALGITKVLLSEVAKDHRGVAD